MPLRDHLPPRRVLRELDEHDRVMRVERDRMGLANAIYLTKFWEFWVGFSGRAGRNGWTLNGYEMQVNRIKGQVDIYAAALYPRANRVVCGDDPMGRGDSHLAALALNGWWSKPGLHRQIRESVVLTTLFPGCAFKVGYETGRGSAIERTWMRVIPPWEVVLDRNVTNLEDERFRGHVYWDTKDAVEARYPKLAGKLVGQRRTDFFELAGTGQAPVATNNPTGNGETGSDAEDGEFVRVFEVANLVDPVVGDSGDLYIGRLEVYVLDQPGEISLAPVVMAPLQFSDAEGRPLPHLELLSFDNEPGYPLRPVAPIARLLPQQIELNKYRTRMAEMTRYSQRKGIRRKGAMSQDMADKLMNANDMEIPEADVDPATPLSDVIWWLPNPPIPSDFKEWMAIVDADLTRVAGTSPAARGEITKATAYEVQTVQLFTESDLGYHGLILYECMARVARLIQRAIIGAMTDRGDSEDGVSDGALAAVGAVDAEGGTADGADEAESLGEAAPALAPDQAEATPEGIAPARPAKAPPQALRMRDRTEMVEITVEDLDADFEITFTEGGRTPLSDEAMLQFLTGPQVDEYFKLWDLVQKGGPGGLLAERWLTHLAERADLPKDMRPEELQAAWAKKQAEEPAKPAGGAPEAMSEAAPEDANTPPSAANTPEMPPQPPGEGTNAVVSVLSGALQALAGVVRAAPEAKTALIPAAQALQQAMEAAKTGDSEALQTALAMVSDALSGVDPATLGPEQAQIVAQVADVVGKALAALAEAA